MVLGKIVSRFLTIINTENDENYGETNLFRFKFLFILQKRQIEGAVNVFAFICHSNEETETTHT